MRLLNPAVLCALFAPCAHTALLRSFVVHSRATVSVIGRLRACDASTEVEQTRLPPTEADLIGYWELEEAEDECTAHTLLRLLPAGAIEFGKTDGPVPTGASGSWALVDPLEGKVALRVTRRFEDCRFPYEVVRLYEGFLEDDGPVRSVQGPIEILQSDEGKSKIDAGFFALTLVPDFPEDDMIF
mmetsp:Transcript_15324/g.41168  ORF Transcript_15324/g.41168 Transcript_15324/m.41168 type:complete len:185 (-) Transcript_15324:912-1466(-)